VPLAQVALVLAGQVHAPLDGKLEGFAAAPEDVDGLACSMRSKGRSIICVQPRQNRVVDALVEEGEVVLALVEHREMHVLEQVLGEVGVVGKIREGHLRLDHPELGQVAAGVAVLGAEGRPEGVHLAHRQAVGLHLQLAADREEGLAGEEIPLEVHAAIGPARQVGEVQGTDPEQLAGALAVTTGDDRRIDPVEAVVVKVPVNRLARLWRTRVMAPKVLVRTRRCACVRRYSKAVALLGDRVALGVIHPADHRTALAWISMAWPLPWDSTSWPSTSTAQPVVRCRTSLS
jgi:hypothetical protein